MTTMTSKEKRIIANEAMNVLINRVGFTEYIEAVMRGAPMQFSGETELLIWVKQIYEAVNFYGYFKDLAFESFLSMAEKELNAFGGYVGLKALRAERGITQQALADKTGLSVSQVRNLESGEILFDNITVRNAMNIAKTLDLSMDELITFLSVS